MQERALRLFHQKIDAEAIMPNGLYPVWPPTDSRIRGADLYEQFERDPRLPKLLSGRTARCAGRSLYSHGPLRSIVLAFGDRRHRLGQNAEASLSGQVTLNALQFGGDPASRIA